MNEAWTIIPTAKEELKQAVVYQSAARKVKYFFMYRNYFLP